MIYFGPNIQEPGDSVHPERRSLETEMLSGVLK